MYVEFRKIVTTILYARQQKKHRCKEQTFGLCGRRQGWDDVKEQHWNMYITICKIDDQCKFNAWSRALTGALRQPRGMGWGERWEGFQDGETHVWQKPTQYCKKKICYPAIKINKLIKKKKKNTGADSHSFFQRIFPTQGWTWGVLHCRWILYQLSY